MATVARMIQAAPTTNMEFGRSSGWRHREVVAPLLDVPAASTVGAAWDVLQVIPTESANDNTMF